MEVWEGTSQSLELYLIGMLCHNLKQAAYVGKPSCLDKLNHTVKKSGSKSLCSDVKDCQGSGTTSSWA